jgi:excisionase family DNA binding protein
MNKRETAEELGVTPRTLERHMSAKRIAFSTRTGKTGKEAYFDPAEVARFKAEIEGVTHSGEVMSEPAPTSSVESRQDPRQAMVRRASDLSLTPVLLGTGDALETPEMRERMIAAFEMMASPVRLTDKLTLSLTEAALLSGLSRGHLRGAIKEGKLKAAIIGRGWKVKREALDLYVKKL